MILPHCQIIKHQEHEKGTAHELKIIIAFFLKLNI